MLPCWHVYLHHRRQSDDWTGLATKVDFGHSAVVRNGPAEAGPESQQITSNGLRALRRFCAGAHAEVDALGVAQHRCTGHQGHCGNSDRVPQAVAPIDKSAAAGAPQSSLPPWRPRGQAAFSWTQCSCEKMTPPRRGQGLSKYRPMDYARCAASAPEPVLMSTSLVSRKHRCPDHQCHCGNPIGHHRPL